MWQGAKAASHSSHKTNKRQPASSPLFPLATLILSRQGVFFLGLSSTSIFSSELTFENFWQGLSITHQHASLHKILKKSALPCFLISRTLVLVFTFSLLHLPSSSSGARLVHALLSRACVRAGVLSRSVSRSLSRFLRLSSPLYLYLFLSFSLSFSLALSPPPFLWIPLSLVPSHSCASAHVLALSRHRENCSSVGNARPYASSYDFLHMFICGCTCACVAIN